MRTAGRSVRTWLIVGLLVLLATLGVPAILSFARPDRERDDTRIVLVVGRGVARL